jgi:hypothetical protein
MLNSIGLKKIKKGVRVRSVAKVLDVGFDK